MRSGSKTSLIETETPAASIQVSHSLGNCSSVRGPTGYRSTHLNTTTFYRHHIYTQANPQTYETAPRRKSTRTSQKKSVRAPKTQPSTRKKTPALTQQERKEQGLCRCGQATIQGLTCCPACAEKHRTWRRHNTEQRQRAEGANPHQPTPGTSETPLQKSLPIDGISERKSPIPQKNEPAAIRPHPRTRGRVNKNLQRRLPLYQQPDPPVSP